MTHATAIKALLGPGAHARGIAHPVSMELVRPLTRDDLAQLHYAPLTSYTPIRKARAMHHRQAQLLAEGRPIVEIAMLVGTSPARINQLEKDPTFRELVAYYASQEHQHEFETVQRIRSKIVDILEIATDEIHDRLEDDTNRAKMKTAELLKVAEWAGDRSVTPPRATQQGNVTPPAKIELNFGFEAKPEMKTISPSASEIEP